MKRYALLYAVWLSACAAPLHPISGTLHSGLSPNAAERIQPLLRWLPPARPALSATSTGQLPTPAIAWVATGPQGGLQLRELRSGKLLWGKNWRPDTRPVVLDDLVLVQRGTALWALDRETGVRRYSAPLPMPGLHQVIGNAHSLYVVTRSADSQRWMLRALDRNTGAVRFDHSVPGSIGHIAATDCVLAVPIRGQTLALLDARGGRLLAQQKSFDDQITWAALHSDGLYFGDQWAYPLTASYDGTRQSVAAQPLLTVDTTLPGQPQLLPEQGQVVPARATAFGRVSVEQGPGHANGPPALYSVFYRHVLGLDERGRPLWARQLPADAVHAVAGERGLWVVLTSGQVWWLEAGSGAVARLWNAPATAVHSAQLAPQTPAAPAGLVLDSAPPLRDALRGLTLDMDARLVPSRLFALRALLAADGSPAHLDLLLELATRPRVPPSLADAARTALGQEPAAAPLLLAKLENRGDWIEGTSPPPLGVLAQALAALNAQAAIPALRAWLFDYRAPLDDLPTVARALVTLDPQQAFDPLLQFVTQYRADSSVAAHPELLLAIAELLFTADPERAAPQLQALVQRPHNTAPFAVGLQAALAAHTPQPSAAKSSQTEASRSPSAPAAVESTPQVAQLNAHVVAQVFATQEQALYDCISAQAPQAKQLRIAMVVQAGRPEHRYYAPAEAPLVRCLDAVVARLRFPRTPTDRQMVTYTADVVRSGQHTGQLATAPQDGESTAWWQPFAAMAAAGRNPNRQLAPAVTAPWWQDQNPFVEYVQPAYERGQSSSTSPTRPPQVTAPVEEQPVVHPPASADPQPATESPADADDSWWTPSAAQGTQD